METRIESWATDKYAKIKLTLGEIEMRKIISIFSVVFFLTISCTITFGQIAPGAVFYLDAADNPGHPDVWTNLGTAGGEIRAIDAAPVLEEGKIDIPNTGFVLANAKYYTGTRVGLIFGSPPDTNPDLTLEEWTLELLCRRNGGAKDRDNGIIGFRPGSDNEDDNEVSLIVQKSTTELSIHYPLGEVNASGLFLEIGEWNWIAISSDRGTMIKYQNGEAVGEEAGWTFNKTVDVDGITIFARTPMSRQVSFIGSIAFVRMYDRVLSAAEIKGNMETTFAVDPVSKLTTTWGREKTRY